MSDTFDQLVPDATAFFTDLKANNSRDWFQENKARYDGLIKKPATLLTEVIGSDLAKITGVPMSSKLFRVNRDVRFSKDKSPYNNHLHMIWVPEGHKQGEVSGYFLGIAPDYVITGAGRMGFEKAALDTYRTAVAGPDGAGLASALAKVTAQGARLDDPHLKRVPAAFDKDHPRGDLLRRRGLVIWFDAAAEARTTGLVTAALNSFEIAQPVARWLDSI
ncbi:TIGR02453 family protein [Actibacterium sp. 188UL27-1]|uniref:TIGR02453 family protein n=1 Tax=Actibacterium sp. 188UL27-1 TaxID=2786961 RepID=UPI00195BB02D|nr:TIGR02453 family protein [Actibacterium sp. 188UL27-1]MBM7066867.1 TIGR02453 family protein [Actibacterium sp. 188UL27-1]